MEPISRRQFVVGAAATLTLPATARAAGTSWIYTAESGRRVIGVLTTTDPVRHEHMLAGLKVACGYARRLRYTSTDRLKAPLALAVIDHLAKADDLWFTAFAARSGEKLAALRARVAHQIGVAAPTGNDPHLRELTAFLTGCAYGALTGVAQPVKRALSAETSAAA
jgi:hypothetical protein